MTKNPKEFPTFDLRINGVAVKASLRRKADDPDEYDVVVCDAAIGEFDRSPTRTCHASKP
jgi:hypothetical protein